MPFYLKYFYTIISRDNAFVNEKRQKFGFQGRFDAVLSVITKITRSYSRENNDDNSFGKVYRSYRS